MQRRVRRDDAGQVVTALVVAVVLGTVVVLLAVLLPLAGASDQRSRAQTAADAAALAALEALGDRVRDRLGRPVAFDGDTLKPLVGCRDGLDRAREYAGRNRADLTEYDSRSCGRSRQATAVQTEVRMRDPLPGGERSQARAAARMDFTVGECRLSPNPQKVVSNLSKALKDAAEAEKKAYEEYLEDVADTPPGEPLPPPYVPPPPADPPAPVEVRADCGSATLSLRLEFPSLTSPALVLTGPTGGDLDDLLEPRLVSTRRFGL